jgi:hypothetical protein
MPPQGKGKASMESDMHDEFDILDNGNLARTKFMILANLPEEIEIIEPKTSPQVLTPPAHTLKPLLTPMKVIPEEVELILSLVSK